MSLRIGARGSQGIPPQVVFEVLSPGNTLREMLQKLRFYEHFGPEGLDFARWDPLGEPFVSPVEAFARFEQAQQQPCETGSAQQLLLKNCGNWERPHSGKESVNREQSGREAARQIVVKHLSHQSAPVT